MIVIFHASLGCLSPMNFLIDFFHYFRVCLLALFRETRRELVKSKVRVYTNYLWDFKLSCDKGVLFSWAKFIYHGRCYENIEKRVWDGEERKLSQKLIFQEMNKIFFFAWRVSKLIFCLCFDMKNNKVKSTKKKFL